MSGREFKSVHDAHCCKQHGCKYGDEDCPVAEGDEPGVSCEECDYDDAHDAVIAELIETVKFYTGNWRTPGTRAYKAITKAEMLR